VSLRSLLFAPGDSEKKLAKAAESGADCVILDLEDSVAASRKPVAREMVRDYLKAGTNPKVEFYVRVNPLDGPYCLADIAAVAPAAPKGLVVPKANNAAELVQISHMLDVLEAEHGLPAGGIGILPVATETAAAVFNLGSYSKETPRLRGITWGAEDLGAAVGASTNLEASGQWTSPYVLVRSLCLFAAHASGVQAIDTVMADFKNLAGLEQVCNDARRDGFTGKICIHPAQVEVINRAFTPSEAEVAHARAVLAAFAANPDAGTLQLDGKMIDKPHQVQAERIVAMAARLAGR
jgi:citrate lyase subunit beta / citryl-CoA lyase